MWALIDYGRFPELLRCEAALLADSARSAPHEAQVPACPGRGLGETVRHVGSVYRFVHDWLRSGSRPASWQRAPEPGQPVEDYLAAALEDLLGELTARPAEAYAPGWWPADETYGFWQRRMTHETAMHRTDVQAAAEHPVSAVDEALAIDGIDEVLHLWFGYRLSLLGVTGTRSGTVQLDAGGYAWRAEADRAQVTARRASAPGQQADAWVRGSPAQVYLWLWGRQATGAVTTGGDEDAIAQLWALLRLATR